VVTASIADRSITSMGVRCVTHLALSARSLFTYTWTDAVDTAGKREGVRGDDGPGQTTSRPVPALRSRGERGVVGGVGFGEQALERGSVVGVALGTAVVELAPVFTPGLSLDHDRAGKYLDAACVRSSQGRPVFARQDTHEPVIELKGR